MQTRTQGRRAVGAALLLIGLAAGVAGIAAAGVPPYREGPPDSHRDARDGRPPRGAVVPHLPPGAAIVRHGRDRYWYGSGVWYAPRGPRYVVVGPPRGVFVHVLPPFYTTVWFGAVPYYFADGAYYLWREERRAYEVVDPPSALPSRVDDAGPTDLYVYPRAGQSAEQQARDRYECHRWAADQTRFDPTQSSPGLSPAEIRTRRADYFRATTACLEARGYSVR
jgi:hypothetical protein